MVRCRQVVELRGQLGEVGQRRGMAAGHAAMVVRLGVLFLAVLHGRMIAVVHVHQLNVLSGACNRGLLHAGGGAIGSQGGAG